MALFRKLKYENTDNAFKKPSYFKIDDEAGKSKAVLISVPLLITIGLAAVLLSLMIGFLLGCYCQAQADHDEYLEDFEYITVIDPSIDDGAETDDYSDFSSASYDGQNDEEYPVFDLAVLRK